MANLIPPAEKAALALLSPTFTTFSPTDLNLILQTTAHILRTHVPSKTSGLTQQHFNILLAFIHHHSAKKLVTVKDLAGRIIAARESLDKCSRVDRIVVGWAAELIRDEARRLGKDPVTEATRDEANIAAVSQILNPNGAEKPKMVRPVVSLAVQSRLPPPQQPQQPPRQQPRSVNAPRSIIGGISTLSNLTDFAGATNAADLPADQAAKIAAWMTAHPETYQPAVDVLPGRLPSLPEIPNSEGLRELAFPMTLDGVDEEIKKRVEDQYALMEYFNRHDMLLYQLRLHREGVREGEL